jgi:hypothetical protein
MPVDSMIPSYIYAKCYDLPHRLPNTPYDRMARVFRAVHTDVFWCDSLWRLVCRLCGGEEKVVSYVYQRATGENFYVVGFFDPSGKWHAESDQATREQAADRVAWLNGSGSMIQPCSASPKAGDD